MAELGQVGEEGAPGAARLLGVHLEGPFLNEKKRGAQPAFTRPIDLAALDALLAAGPVAIVTLAPELARAVGEAGGPDRVGDERQAPAGGAERDPEEHGVDVVAVEHELVRRPLGLERGRGEPGRPVVERAHGVEEVRGPAGAGGEGGGGDGVVGVAVAEARAHAAGGQAPHGLEGALELGGQGHDRHGADVLGVDAGALSPGRWADLVALDLHDLSLLPAGVRGARALLSAITSSVSAESAVTDVFVGGRPVVRERALVNVSQSEVAERLQGAKALAGPA